MKASFLCGVTMLLLAPAALGQEANQAKPDFSGTWLLVRGSIRVIGTTFSIAQDATTLRIGADVQFYPSMVPRTYRLDGVWTIEPVREGVRRMYEQVLNGREPAPSVMKTKASWNGRSLALVMSSDLPNSETTRVLRVDDGGLLTIEMTLPRESGLTGVYKKQ